MWEGIDVKKVLVLLANGFEAYEAGIFTDVLDWNLTDGDHSTEIVTYGLEKEIKSTFNLKVTIDIIVDEINIDYYSAVAIPRGFKEYDFYKYACNKNSLV